ncbi:septal ring lytic transglycosylase RlpA family protein [Nonomuraea sp. NPDC050556]|uniref:septal ring lytic transglycosylase RlpA family protein n=1 Tax=Nonomuraea sp. NPDC050556 TaxID=3364369 RepID=UPI0037B23123
MIAIPPPPPAVETCIASYFDGKGGGTASGEISDPTSMTTAHKTLPFDTLVKVSRANDPLHRSVVVRVNERFSNPAHCLVLSKAAFEKLAPISMGLVKVTLSVVPAGKAGAGTTTDTPDDLIEEEPAAS